MLVLDPTYPPSLLDKKLYLAAGVAAAFECKLTLRAEHIAEAVSDAVEVRQQLPHRVGSPYRELYSPLIYGLLAHSHEWTAEGSTPVPNIIRHLRRADIDHVTHPRQMLDFICVANLATWVSRRMSWVHPAETADKAELARLGVTDGVAATMYPCHSFAANDMGNPFTPIGTLISALLTGLAWENRDLRRLARYFLDVGLEGMSSGEMRPWGGDIYSPKTRQQVIHGARLVVGQEWNEWNWLFM